MIWAETPSNPQLKVADIAGLARDRAGSRRAACLRQHVRHARPAAAAGTGRGCGDAFDHQVFRRAQRCHGRRAGVHSGAMTFMPRSRTGATSPAISFAVQRLADPARRALTAGADGLALPQCAQRSPSSWPSIPRWKRVHYPGLASHPGHAVAARQMSDFGGMLSFRLRGGREAALRVAGKLRLFTNATSLGGCESLIEHRASVEGPNPYRRRTCCASRSDWNTPKT